MEKLKTMLKVFIPDTEGLTVPLVFQQDAAHKVWVDWGDGSYPDTYSYEGLIETSHTYAAVGDYTIVMHAVDEGYIILGGGWTGGNTIGGSDEAAARMLVSVMIGEDVVGIADSAFRGCENMETFTIPENQELTLGKFAFECCSSLEEITIPKNTSTISQGAFSNCSALKKVTLPNGVYEIESFAFANCAQLKEVNLYGVSKIDKHAFAGCTMIKEVKLGELAEKIEDGAFVRCSNIRSLTLGKVKSLGEYAFCNCKSLREVVIPQTVETIGAAAFMGCTSLNTIKMEASDPPVLAGADAFERNEKLKITVPYGNTRKYKNDTNWAAFADYIKEGY